MKVNYSRVTALAVISALVCLLVWHIVFSSGDAPSESKTEVVAGNDSPKNGSLTGKMARARGRLNRRGYSRRISSGEHVREKPSIDLSSEEFDELDEFQRELMAALQEALDMNDFSFVQKAIHRMIESGKQLAAKSGSQDWSRHLPIVMRRKALEALGWFGAQSLPEISAFLLDDDPSVAEDAQLQLEQALQDFELSDYALSDIVVSLMKFTNDPDTIDNYYMELSRMRNSVMISTLVQIGESGSDVAKEKLAENISFYTGDFEIETIEQAEQWLEDNPDGENDDEMYGGVQFE